MSNEIQRRQNRFFWLLTCAVLLVVVAISYFTFQDDYVSRPENVQTTLPMDKTKPQDLWMSRFEAEKQITDAKVAYLEKIALDTRKNEEEKERENESLRQEVVKFKQQINSVSERLKNKESIVETSDPFEYSENKINRQVTTRAPLKEIVVDDLPEKILHVDEVIPAGTSVKALLVSSVDMPCGVFSSTDPQPIKLRLMDDGHLPKKVTARLKGGIIIASAYGDLSNERIYIRLERLTQVRGDGKFIETGVTGYVTGEDGKYGLRGVVVDKSYKMVENAAISGVFSGINQYLQASASSRSCNIYEPGCSMNGCDLAAQGGYQGANSAFDILTDYYIKRAEQIRPVIQAEAGRIVDVTFTHNAELGDLYTKEKVKQIRENCRKKS